MQKSCGECRKLMTDECRRPDHCVGHGYCDFGQARPWEQCPYCGVKFKRPRNRKIGTVIITDLVCPNPDCKGRVDGVPVKGEDRREFVLRSGLSKP
jgi:hypothetical protein